MTKNVSDGADGGGGVHHLSEVGDGERAHEHVSSLTAQVLGGQPSTRALAQRAISRCNYLALFK